MSWIFLRQSEVKARKEHKCLCCGEEILVGEKYIERVGTDEKDIISMKMHKECENESSRWDDDDWECFDRYSMDRPNPAVGETILG